VPIGGSSSDIKDVAEAIHNQLFPALTSLLERFGYMGEQQNRAEGGKQGAADTSWANQAFQVKVAADELTEQLRRAGLETVGQLRLPRQITDQPGGERYRDQQQQ
jgi:hypothetical protein